MFTVVNDYDEDFRQRAAELREERRQRARELREEGLSLRAIAERLGVDHGTVLRDLRSEAQVAADWFDEQIRAAQARNRIDTATESTEDMAERLARSKPGPMVQDAPPRPPTDSELMDQWLRSPAARRGVRLTGYSAADAWIHEQAAKAERARLRRQGIDLEEDE